MHTRAYSDLLRYARKTTKRADEAEDLLQTVLLAAIEAGRTDTTCPENRRWILGALRKRALFDARSAIRRRRREEYATTAILSETPDVEALPLSLVNKLSPPLRLTALLALSGHTKPEIAYLLRLSDATLRQRIASIKRQFRKEGQMDLSGVPGLEGLLAYGRIRKALLKTVHKTNAVLGSHDPDGFLFIVSSQNGNSRQHVLNPNS